VVGSEAALNSRLAFLVGAIELSHLDFRSYRLSHTITNASQKTKAERIESRMQAIVATMFAGVRKSGGNRRRGAHDES
jgi:hypothetical protein